MSEYRSLWTTYLYDVAFRQGFLDAGGIRTRYVQAGPEDAPAIIMLHGTGGTKESELPFLTELARAGFIAVSIDGRHHGARARGIDDGKRQRAGREQQQRDRRDHARTEHERLREHRGAAQRADAGDQQYEADAQRIELQTEVDLQLGDGHPREQPLVDHPVMRGHAQQIDEELDAPTERRQHRRAAQ